MSLKEQRTAAGMTQRELAERAGVSLRMVQNYEQGQKDIKKAQVVTVLQIAKVLDCEIEKLL